MARGVEPGMQPGLNAPVVDIGIEPLRGREFMLWSAGDQGDGFFTPFPEAMHARGLRHQGEAGGFASEVARDERAGYQFAFFEITPADGRWIDHGRKRGVPGSGVCASTTAFSRG